MDAGGDTNIHEEENLKSLEIRDIQKNIFNGYTVGQKI